MSYHFCTPLNKNYFYRGLALYNSMVRFCPDFKLHVLCMDDLTYELLKKIGLEKIEPISLKEFEDPELLKVKNGRTEAEYCWTCTASLILFLLKKYRDLEMVTYIDADMLFFSDPEPIFEEFGGDSIFITEHDFSREYQRLISNGKYNVQFLIFKNDQNALEALEWWRKRTIEWCYRCRDGKKGGDQMYLEDWPQRFKKVHVLQNKRLCLAPWNATNHRIEKINGGVYVDNTKLVFYHFHGLLIHTPLKFSLAPAAYKIDNPLKDLVYQPYIEEIKKAIEFVKETDPSFSYGFRKLTLRERVLGVAQKIVYDFIRSAKRD